jgi:hypothetical protein
MFTISLNNKNIYMLSMNKKTKTSKQVEILVEDGDNGYDDVCGGPKESTGSLVGNTNGRLMV